MMKNYEKALIKENKELKLKIKELEDIISKYMEEEAIELGEDLSDHYGVDLFENQGR